MPDLLTGIDLQRAIAEKKGWKKIVNGRGTLVGVPPPYTDGESLTRLPIIDIEAAHALLDELVAEGWDWSFGHYEGEYWAQAWRPKDIAVEHQINDAPDFCTAVGNLWLRCRG